MFASKTAAETNAPSFPARATELEMCTTAVLEEGLALYRMQNVNLVHIVRDMPFLNQIAKFGGEFELSNGFVPRDDIWLTLSSEMHRAGFEQFDPEASKAWVNDMEKLALAHADILNRNELRIVLRTLTCDTITDPAAWTFLRPHIDQVASNLVVGYMNYGPDYYDNDAVNRSAAIQNRASEKLLKEGAAPHHTGTGDAVFLKGDPIDGKDSLGAAHRSPHPLDPLRPYEKRVVFIVT